MTEPAGFLLLAEALTQVVLDTLQQIAVRENIGLDQVDNTSDVNKPVSTATTAAVNAAIAALTKASVGLGNVDNTSDVNKPVSTATTTAINALLDAQNAEQFKGLIDCSANPNYPAASAGHVYKVSVAGKIGGASGTNVEINDRLMCIVDSTAAGTQAAVGASWWVTQGNVDFSSNGVSLVTAANYAAMKTLLAITLADITDASANGRSLVAAANYAAMRTLLGVGLSTTPKCGILTYVSATTIKFAPFGGDLIRINGVDYQIPSAGIAGVANTSVYVGGVAAQNLAASTYYRVYCFDNGGTLTADFRTGARSTSATAGNVGTEILTGDDTRTLIGAIRTNASSQFEDVPASRCVRSWFNDPGIMGKVTPVSALALGNGSNTEVSTSLRIGFVAWAGELVHAACIGYGYNGVANQSMSLVPGFNGTAETAGSSRFDTFTASVNASTALSSASDKNDFTDGYNYASAYYSSTGGAGASNFVVSNQITAKR